MMQCSLVSYRSRCHFASAASASAASASADAAVPVSVVCVVDRAYVSHVEVTRAAGNWARIVIRAPPDQAHSYVGSALRDSLTMLHAVGPCGHTALRLDAVHVGGPDYVDGLPAEICRAWQMLAGSPDDAADIAADYADMDATAAAVVRVRERAAGGGAPDFARTSARANTAARNYVATTRGNSELSDAVITEVCDNLRASSLASSLASSPPQ